MKRSIEPFLHVLFWMLVFYITYSNFGVKIRMVKIGEDFSYTKEYTRYFAVVATLFVGFKALLFYGASQYFLPRIFASVAKKKHILGLAIYFLITLGFSLAINYYVIKNYGHKVNKGVGLIAYSVFIHFLILCIAIAYRLSKDWYKNEVVINRLMQEKLQTELEFLKGQINPHFMFNTLNNLYAEARKHEDRTVSNGIAKLSHMMRYMIYDSNVEKVSLDKEIQYIRSYIELQKLRVSVGDPFEITLEAEGVDMSAKLAPILFIPFVENAFKYGMNPNKPSYIRIRISSDRGRLHFHIVNTKTNILSVESASGIGLTNVRRRLSLLYPGRHELIIKDEEEIFTVDLILDINEGR